MRPPEIELLWWEGCPSTEHALSDLRDVLKQEGLEHVEVRMRAIRTDQEAEQADFKGSPTILIDGVDLAPTDDPAGLACRIYRRRDGRISPTPDPEDLRAALRQAADGLETMR